MERVENCVPTHATHQVVDNLKWFSIFLLQPMLYIALGVVGILIHRNEQVLEHGMGKIMILPPSLSTAGKLGSLEYGFLCHHKFQGPYSSNYLI